LITPGIVLAQKGQDRQGQQGHRGDHDAHRAAAAHQLHVVPQQPERVRQEVVRARDAAGDVDRRYARPRVVQHHYVAPRLSHGDVTRSLRADERANDVAAHRRARKHHKHHEHHKKD
jgi:hypothetical protein